MENHDTTDLAIDHTDETGTILEGTSRGDGTAEIVKTLGWRWGRSITAWYIPRSRNTPPKRALIERTSQALQAAGFTVAVDIDATPQDRAEAEERRTAQSEDRAEMLTDRATKQADLSEARWDASRRISDGIPFGQPILMGHHSQRRAERDRDRIGAHMDASIEHQALADKAAQAAKAAAHATFARNNPVTVANRINRLDAAVRKDEREIARLEQAGRASGDYWQTVTERLTADRADRDFWRGVRADQIAAGIATDFGRGQVQAGDAVKIRGSWRRVVRANAKTVTVETGYSWTDKAPWQEVQDHRPVA